MLRDVFLNGEIADSNIEEKKRTEDEDCSERARRWIESGNDVELESDRVEGSNFYFNPLCIPSERKKKMKKCIRETLARQ